MKSVNIFKTFYSEDLEVRIKNQNLNSGNDLCFEFIEDKLRLFGEKAHIMGRVLDIDYGKTSQVGGKR